jgi:hypothetical protein
MYTKEKEKSFYLVQIFFMFVYKFTNFIIRIYDKPKQINKKMIN